MARRASTISLDERVTFERATNVSDGGGGSTLTWATYFTCAAMVEAISGRERANADQTQSPRNYRVTLWRSSETAGLTTRDRLDWRGKKMQIRFIADEGPRPLYLMLDCEAGVNT